MTYSAFNYLYGKKLIKHDKCNYELRKEVREHREKGIMYRSICNYHQCTRVSRGNYSYCWQHMIHRNHNGEVWD